MHQLPEGHVRGTERERRPVEVAGLAQPVEPQLPQRSQEGFAPHHLQGAHRRYVQRRGQRAARAHAAPEPAVVVSGLVDPAVHGHVQGAVVQEGGRRQDQAVEGERVEKRLQRGPRLPPGRDPVHKTGPARIRGGAHIGQNIAGRILHHEHGPLPHVLRLQGQKVMGEPLQRKPLDIGVQAAGNRLPGLAPQQPPGRVRRKIDSGPNRAGV